MSKYITAMTKHLFISASLLFAALLFTACNRFYKNPDFEAKTQDHRTIALLPFQITITGRLPKDLTPENRKKIEEAESVAFQRSFYSQIHIVGARGSRQLSVVVQPTEKTNQILADNGIGTVESWDQDPQKLAELLGVDAVVRCKAIKQRYLSDLESIGVQVGTTILKSVFGLGYFGWAGRTNDVEVMTNIIDATDGDNLFSGRDEVSVDWSRPANEAVEQINRRIARRFPYVNK